MSAASPAATVSVWPGLGLVGALAAAAFGVRSAFPQFPISLLMLAILLGALWRNLLGVPSWAGAGIAASLRRPLRLGIVLLGAQLSFGQLLEIGAGGLALLLAAVLLSFVFTLYVGRWLGVERGMTYLLATGTAICGASAIVAANSVVRQRGEAVAYALGVVTLYGTVVMLAFPLLGLWCGLSERAYGVWVGAAVHEVAQVVAAGFAHGELAGQYGAVSKLTRVMLLAPMILLIAKLWRRDGEAERPDTPIPWFAFGFIGMMAIVSTGLLPASSIAVLALASQALLAVALAAVGLETDLKAIAAQGWRPLALGGVATLFIGGLALVGVVVGYD